MHEKKNLKELFSKLIPFSLIFALIFLVVFLLSSNLTDLSSYDIVLAFPPTPSTNQSANNTSIVATNHPPVSNAGQNQIVNENITVTLVGAGIDSDANDKLSYLWRQTGGPEVRLSNPTATNPTFVAPMVGSDTKLDFTLITTDNNRASSTPAVVTITIKHINRSPIADAGKDKVVDGGYVVSLDGTSSKDPDNNQLTYSWTQISGKPSIKLNGADKSIATFTAPSNISADTNLIFKLTVKDDKNAIDSDDTKVTIRHIPPVNQSPIANAGTDHTVNVGETVQLDGTKSIDSDGNITSYSWSQLAGQPVALIANHTAKSSFIAPSNSSASTSLVFQLTAMDEKNATDISTTKITVKPANRAPVADAGVNQTVSAGDIATLDGTKSKDPDSDPLTYSWKQASGPTVTLNGADKPIATFTTPTDITSDTSLLFELTVTDDKNAKSSTTCQVIVKYVPPLNQPPIANAGQDQTVDAGTDVTLDGSASSDPDGSVSSYSWMQTEGQAVTLSNANVPSPTFVAPTNITADTTLKFLLTANDDKDATSTPVSVSISVKAATQPETVPPVTTGPANESSQETSTAANEYVFVTKWGSLGTGNGQFSDPEGVAVDSLGNVYVADFNNNRIQKFDSEGNHLTNWGSYGSTGDGQFSNPNGVAVDSSGNVYVADFSNSRIQKLDSDGNFITKWGSFGTGDGQFILPRDVAVDTSGKVYVTDSGVNRIQKFDGNGNFITKWGSNGTGDGQFDYPVGLAVDSSSNVYVADDWNHRIQKFDGDGNYITEFYGTSNGQFSNPNGVAVDSSGNVYVADTANSRIQKFDNDGNFITKWGSNGTGDGQFVSPVDIAVDTSGKVYVTDSGNNRIQVFSPG